MIKLWSFRTKCSSKIDCWMWENLSRFQVQRQPPNAEELTEKQKLTQKGVPQIVLRLRNQVTDERHTIKQRRLGGGDPPKKHLWAKLCNEGSWPCNHNTAAKRENTRASTWRVSLMEEVPISCFFLTRKNKSANMRRVAPRPAGVSCSGSHIWRELKQMKSNTSFLTQLLGMQRCAPTSTEPPSVPSRRAPPWPPLTKTQVEGQWTHSPLLPQLVHQRTDTERGSN